MVNIVVEISKYFIIFFMAIYTFECFSVFRKKHSKETKELILSRQIRLVFFIHFFAFVVILIKSQEIKVLLFYGAQLFFFIVVLLLYKWIYPGYSRLLVNNMILFMTISMIMITRIDFDKALKQFKIGVVAVLLTMIIPYFIHKLKFLTKLKWLYAVAGLGLLGMVAVIGRVSYGAKLSISVGGISIQPSELVKIIFVFFVASMLEESTEFKNLVKTTIFAALHVLVLVASKDLGSALIFFITYLVMLYVATQNGLYFGAGILSGVIASIGAYALFDHVRIRVLAWKDPFSVIDNEGYQITQSLFAIGTGGWFGMGIYQGSPLKIPVVEEDFIFSAISEELGGIVALCMIIICISCFLMFLNIAMELKVQFYKLIALGLGTTYGFQVFLTVGGVTKFIPSTGVTFPLVSYGGSSLFCSLIVFSIIQGFYVLNADKDDNKNVQIQKER